ncbi:saccharopine dehydrogenase like protein [Zymoseptoria brevis]|uniref:Saccharopine dehydrogenase like protein n=1 Tax=Zymoseptoria brevis TaxID=1047168 RepID=A0A0F4GV25_9PEZI|nr:saccharopine dehydrogenase like protein [Zymoseptoria brevis]
MSRDQRQYEIVVFGATGYTGKYTAEHLTTYAPTDLRWAIAGRSEAKLKAVADEIHSLNPDRLAPGIEIAELNKQDLVKLAKTTKVLISTVGPYHKYGAFAFEACAENGTHYVDCTGEVPWVYDMVEKYDALAKKTGAIMIPQNGMESAPSDMMCWMLVNHIRQTLSVGTAEILDSVYSLKGAPSGGTLDTLLTLFDTYSLSHFAKSMNPWSLSAVAPPQETAGKPLLEKITGIRTDSDLGILTDSLQGPSDIVIVNRSWSLYDGGKFYGPKFKISIYTKVSSNLQAFLMHLALTLGTATLLLPPVRWLLKKFVYQPGQGPTKEQTTNDHCEWRAVANADVTDPNDPKRASGTMAYHGSMYALTAATLSEAAITLARDKTFAHELGGGVLTPATLGAPYMERLQKAGLKTEVKTMP